MTPIAEALTLLASLPEGSPEMDYFTREFNLYLDVIRNQGKRDQFSRTDLHVLFARWQDLAQIAPLPPTEGEKVVAETLAEAETQQPSQEDVKDYHKAVDDLNKMREPIPFSPKGKTERVLQ